MLFNAIYGILLKIIELFLPVAAFSNGKIKDFLEGRKRQDLRMVKRAGEGKKVVWMHCASLGEYEQGRTLLEKIKQSNSKLFIVLSFYSSSGFNAVEQQTIADIVLYMPVDVYSKAERFIKAIGPDFAIFVKYEFWYNHLRVLNKLNVPTVFISVAFRKNHFLFSRIFRPLERELKSVQALFVQDTKSQKLLLNRGYENVLLTGDTRVDRSLENVQTQFEDPLIEIFTKNQATIVAGSVWRKDLELIKKIAPKEFCRYQWIIVPHEINENILTFIESSFGQYGVIRYSSNTISPGDKILIVDQVGILKRIYKYGRIAYIGGGFGKGIHNTLEPAAYGIPVIFGPKYIKFIEAVNLVSSKAFFSVTDEKALEEVLFFLDDDANYERVQNTILSYLESNRNASDKILKALERFWRK